MGMPSIEHHADERLLPQVLAKLAGLELKARTAVEGFLSGLHRSPYKGFSLEFVEHRPYFPGDDLRYMDWKVYAKSDRLYVKQFEEETNLRCYLLLDASGSMGYGTTAMNKFEYASVVAAALAYLILRQRDSVGIVLFSDHVRCYIPARAHPAHFTTIVEAIEATRPAGRTNTGAVVNELGESIKRRGLIIILSDLIDDSDSLPIALQFLRHRKHELIAFQVFDPAELELPFDEMATFQDMETRRMLPADPLALRDAYRQQIAQFVDNCKDMCGRLNADHVMLRTDEPLDKSLLSYLSWRARRRWGHYGRTTSPRR